MAKLYYIHDPMCSWCWGYSPTWNLLQSQLPETIVVEYVAGGLAPDSDEPMPVTQQQAIQNHWRNIEGKLGTNFNYDFWRKNTPRRSTYNACRAVIAAHNQGFQPQMIEAIQHAYYLNALNPSDVDVLLLAAKSLNQNNQASFDIKKFSNDIHAVETNNELTRQVTLARSLSQQGFPALVLAVDDAIYQIKLDYRNADVSLADIFDKSH